MRVIAGSAKGKKLHAPKGVDTRPTSDRVKEAIFNIIGRKVSGTRVLDLFAGTGNLGIEAMSRGATLAYFVDKRWEAVDVIKRNLEETGFTDKAVVIKSEADKALRRLSKDALKYDIIFVDPPYGISVTYLDAVMFKLASDMLNMDGLLILEHSAKTEPRVVEGIETGSTRFYGDTAVTFYHKRG
ncbi:MAG TPA: 16S rRNA (guanine(966)-N(2))-methyltransferase RsmD [Anaerolineae bacterium]|jgi:16S rRNA (guanine(966)-N(2))-methyltransferase RsmD|nr:16S rRNA (guanine(966)-N(2))-methyltransferase RsmD [Anaerolineae bacterium]